MARSIPAPAARRYRTACRRPLDRRTGTCGLTCLRRYRFSSARTPPTAADLTFTETGPAHGGQIALSHEACLSGIGDVVLARRDFGTSYHLSVVLDDAAQGISHVVRGEDLFDATPIHVVLQRLLTLPVPVYHHHRLIRDDSGKRLAKRDDARALRKFREDGLTPDDIRAMVGLPKTT